MLIMQISRHSPESCAMFHEEARNVMVALMRKMDELLGKHGVKMVGSWTNAPNHTIYAVFDAPSMEEYRKLVNEPVMMAWLKYHRVREEMVMGWEEGRVALGLK